MPVKGIDEEKCSGCGQCLNECPTLNFRMEESKKKAVFSPLACMGCGHCIAICPEDAIIYKNMKDEALSFGGVLDPSTLIQHDSMYRFMRAKRSVRQYKKKKIPKEELEKIIDIMRYAPTGSNIRQMKCLVISDDEQINKLGDAVSNALKSTMPAAYTGMFDRKNLAEACAKVRAVDIEVRLSGFIEISKGSIGVTQFLFNMTDNPLVEKITFIPSKLID